MTDGEIIHDVCRTCPHGPGIICSVCVEAVARRCRDAGRAERDALAARVKTLEGALRTIQGWDCLNPPDPNLCHDHPWLKRLVDAALAPPPGPEDV